MNTPATRQGNWQWRMPDDGFNDELVARLAALADLYGRSIAGDRAD